MPNESVSLFLFLLLLPFLFVRDHFVEQPLPLLASATGLDAENLGDLGDGVAQTAARRIIAIAMYSFWGLVGCYLVAAIDATTDAIGRFLEYALRHLVRKHTVLGPVKLHLLHK